jgi:hypothetical protein
MNPVLLLLAMAVSCAAAEGLVFEQETITNEGARRSMIRVQGHKVRLDFGNGSSAIVETDTKRVTTIFHHDAFAIESQGDEAMRKAGELVQTGSSRPRMAPKMFTAKIDGHECEVSDWEWGAWHTAIWVARDFPKAEQFAKYAEVLSSFFCDCLAGLSSRGVAMKTISGRKEAPRTVKFVAARIEEIPAEVFEVPGGMVRKKENP